MGHLNRHLQAPAALNQKTSPSTARLCGLTQCPLPTQPPTWPDASAIAMASAGGRPASSGTSRSAPHTSRGLRSSNSALSGGSERGGRVGRGQCSQRKGGLRLCALLPAHAAPAWLRQPDCPLCAVAVKPVSAVLQPPCPPPGEGVALARSLSPVTLHAPPVLPPARLSEPIVEVVRRIRGGVAPGALSDSVCV